MSLLRVMLQQDRGGILGWTIGLGIYMAIITLSYAAFESTFEDLEAAFEGMEGFMDALGVTSFTTVDGYLESQALAFVPLLLGVYGVMAATKALAGAEEAGRLDHLLARPLSRLRYAWTGAASLAIGQASIVAAATVGTVIGYAAAGISGTDLLGSAAMVVEVLPLALAHMAVGYAASAWSHRRGPALAVALAVVFVGFTLDIVAKVVDALDWLQYLSLFGYWARSDAFHGDVDLLYVAACAAVTGAGLWVAAWRFDRKDLY